MSRLKIKDEFDEFLFSVAPKSTKISFLITTGYERRRYMRMLFFVMCLAFLTGCATTGDWLPSSIDGKAVEAAILWETELDESWTPEALGKILNDPGRFEKNGNFYRVKDDLVVFGHRASYVGMLGVDLFVGPNALLKGSPRSIAAYIAQYHDLEFKSSNGIYLCDLKKETRLWIEKHPEMRGYSIIIGVYTGP